jgi:hypothetical protein
MHNCRRPPPLPPAAHRPSKDGNPLVGGRGGREAHARPMDGRRAGCGSEEGGQGAQLCVRYCRNEQQLQRRFSMRLPSCFQNGTYIWGGSRRTEPLMNWRLPCCATYAAHHAQLVARGEW